MLHIALLEPEIALNVGSVARTALATGARLHLVRPLGFRLTDAGVRRSGMDYWDEVDVTVHPGFGAFAEVFADRFAERRVFSLTTKGQRSYSEVSYRDEDLLLFGPESRGLPEAVRAQTEQLRVPMTPQARSLNLAVSVGVVVYEAWRQLGFGKEAGGL